MTALLVLGAVALGLLAAIAMMLVLPWLMPKLEGLFEAYERYLYWVDRRNR